MFGLSGLAAQLVIAAGIFLGGLGIGAWTTHQIDGNQYKALELSYQQAQIKAVQQAQEEQRKLDAIAVAAAQKEAQTQANLTAKAKRQLAEVSKHVNNKPCVTYGLVRVVDSAVHGVLADQLKLPAGKSDDTCAPISAADLARSIVDNYNTANANKEQLNALISTLRAMQK